MYDVVPQLCRLSQLRVSVALVCVLVLAACVAPTRWGQTPQKTHVVRSGETLSTIAFRYGADPNVLARWNNLGDGSLIFPGQVIYLTAPVGGSRNSRGGSSIPKQNPRPAPADPSPAWGWPTRGRIAAEYTGAPGSGTGIVINGNAGQAILAAASGRVVYSGGGLIGYGQLIIIKHNNTYLSAYGYNASLLVKEGDLIKRGQRIATMGEGSGNLAQLHFEIRLNGKPVDPKKYLPAKRSAT